MHSFYTRSVAAIALTALLLFGAAQAQAHALYAAHSWQGTVALVQFAYAGGDKLVPLRAAELVQWKLVA